MFALIPIICEQPLILCQICQKSEASHLTQSAVILSRSRTIFRRKRSRRSIPVEIAAVLEFADQPRGIETVPRLPELQDDKPADQGPIERPGREHAEIVNVPCLVAPITGPNFLREDFSEREAGQFGRHKREEPEITLFDLRAPLCWQCGVSRRPIWSMISLPPWFRSCVWVGLTPQDKPSCVS